MIAEMSSAYRLMLVATVVGLATPATAGEPVPAESPPPPASSPGKPGAGASAPPAPSELRGTSVEKTSDGFIQAPKRRLVLQNLLVARLNPVGVEDQIRFGYQQRISDKTTALVLDTFWFIGVGPRINPP